MNITERDYELLSQYLDGELSPSEGSALQQRLENEPALNASLAGLQSIQNELASAYSTLDGPVPARITALLQEPAPIRIVPLPHRRVAGWGFALAASLVVATSATLVSQWSQHSTLPTGNFSEDPMLAATLDNAPSRAIGWEALGDGRNVKPVLSFQSQSGAWCREYLLADGGSHWHAVACRGDNGWTNAVVTPAQLAGSATEYRPAGATDSDAVAEFINRNAADIPLDLSQEAELIGRNWQ